MLSKQIALVTGGSRGIGRAICLELAKNGSYVIINFRSNIKAAEDTLGLIHQVGGRAR
jgi:3-oxoacyl-[acyl-carrier protein] reductase